MKLGNKFCITFVFYLTLVNLSFAENRITTSPLINIEKIKPSFEQIEKENENTFSNQRNMNLKKLTLCGFLGYFSHRFWIPNLNDMMRLTPTVKHLLILNVLVFIGTSINMSFKLMGKL